MNKVAVPKKSLLMFRAITDTASDGQLSILSHVGINIDLTNPNLTFLLRRIRNSGAAASSNSSALSGAVERTASISISPVKVEQMDTKGLHGSINKNKVSNLQTLPKGITISKVTSPPKGTGRPGRPPGSSSTVGYSKPGPKPKKISESSIGLTESKITISQAGSQPVSITRMKSSNSSKGKTNKTKVDLLLSKVRPYFAVLSSLTQISKGSIKQSEPYKPFNY